MGAVVLVNFHFRGDKGQRVPKWMRQLILVRLATILCVRRNVTINDHAETRRDEVEYFICCRLSIMKLIEKLVLTLNTTGTLDDTEIFAKMRKGTFFALLKKITIRKGSILRWCKCENRKKNIIFFLHRFSKNSRKKIKFFHRFSIFQNSRKKIYFQIFFLLFLEKRWRKKNYIFFLLFWKKWKNGGEFFFCCFWKNGGEKKLIFFSAFTLAPS